MIRVSENKDAHIALVDAGVSGVSIRHDGVYVPASEREDAEAILESDWESLAQEQKEKAALENSINLITAYTKSIRDQFSTIDAVQAEAYRQAEEIARRVLSGDATSADEATLKARDVDAATINPTSGKPVKDVTEAAEVIVATAQIWRDVLNTTEIARKQAAAQVRAMDPSDIPDDMDAWLASNFIWLPESLS